MSLLGKYRRDEADKDDDETTTVRREPHDPTKTSDSLSAVPNKERKSPIVSFSELVFRLSGKLKQST